MGVLPEGDPGRTRTLQRPRASNGCSTYFELRPPGAVCTRLAADGGFAGVGRPRGGSKREPSEVIMARQSRAMTSIGETMFFKPLAYPSTLDRRSCANRTSSYVEGFWSPIRARRLEKLRRKLTLIRHCISSARLQRSFSLRRGLDSIQSCFKLSITFCSNVVWSPSNKKATRFGSPSSGLLLRLGI
jgi:hypothetical protein